MTIYRETVTEESHPDFGKVTVTEVQDAVRPPKVRGLSYDEFRKLFTVAELTVLDNHDVDAYVQSVGLQALTVAQKANVRFLIAEAQATGTGPTGINLAGPKLLVAVDALVAYGAIAPERKAEILAGTQKS